jgi:hypothetical protein
LIRGRGGGSPAAGVEWDPGGPGLVRCGGCGSAESDAGHRSDQGSSNERCHGERDRGCEWHGDELGCAPTPIGLVVDREVADEQVELAVCLGGEGGVKAVLELVGQQSSFACGCPQAACGLLAVDV